MNMYRKLNLLGFINAMYMYITYPWYKALEVYCDFLGDSAGFVCVIAFIIAYAVHITVNIIAVHQIKPLYEKESFKDWISVFKGTVIGSIVTVIILLILSIFKTPYHYFYIGIEIPFKLVTSIFHLEYFVVSVIYTIFVYELSKKIYILRS